MKGILTRNEGGIWMVKWSDLHSFGHGTHWMYTELSDDSNSIKYIKDNLIMYKPLEEGVEVEFEMVAGYDNNGPEHFPKYAKILTPEEDELKQVINKIDCKIPKMKFELYYPKKIDK